MPRFDPKHPQQNKVSEFQDSVRDVSNNKNKSLNVFTDMFKRQEKHSVMPPESVLEKLALIWEKEIEPVLISEFGRCSTLYVIFYLGRKQDEIIMEIWHPEYYDTKPSQVFILELLDIKTRHELKNTLKLTEDRAKAKKFSLNNWS